MRFSSTSKVVGSLRAEACAVPAGRPSTSTAQHVPRHQGGALSSPSTALHAARRQVWDASSEPAEVTTVQFLEQRRHSLSLRTCV